MILLSKNCVSSVFVHFCNSHFITVSQVSLMWPKIWSSLGRKVFTMLFFSIQNREAFVLVFTYRLHFYFNLYTSSHKHQVLLLLQMKELQNSASNVPFKKRDDPNNVFWITLISAIKRGKCPFYHVQNYVFDRQKSNHN